MSSTPQKQYSPEELLQMAKALAMLQEGYRAVELRGGGWGVAYPQEAMHVACVRADCQVDALAAAYDVLHPGEDPDVVVLPVDPIARRGSFAIIGILKVLTKERSKAEADGVNTSKDVEDMSWWSGNALKIDAMSALYVAITGKKPDLTDDLSALSGKEVQS